MTVSQAAAGPHSLEDIHASVPVPPASWWKRFFAFSGPAFLVSVGYMDPGNWATDLQAGSQFRYELLWVLLMSNVMAILLQGLASRLGIVTGHDLAQACRERYPRRTTLGLWVLCEIAIAACDLAEVVGTVIALKLLFHLPYLWGLLVAAGDTFVLLALQRRGVRLLELVTLLLVGIIAGSFVIELVLARPDWAAAVRGLIPGLDPGDLRGSLYVSIGMLGATVMPHNLYLHSALVQTRDFPRTADGKRLACRFNFLDSVLALNGAFFVNAAILILAAATFQEAVSTLPEAHRLLKEVWGTAVASGLFAVALLASGQSSTLTGTLAGQVVMEGFIRLRLRPWVRRLMTRSLAICPALVVIGLASHPTLGGAGPADGAARVDPVDTRLLQLVVLSQVVLSFQLPFAIVPLVQFTSDRHWMGEFASRGWLKLAAWASAAVVTGLNAVLLALQAREWAEQAGPQGALWVYGILASLGIGLAAFLGWVALYPWLTGHVETAQAPQRPVLAAVRFQRIGVAVELEGTDHAAVAQAAALARGHGADLVAVHVVEGPSAALYQAKADDLESRSDRRRMAELVAHLRHQGISAQGVLGYGQPAEELVRLAREERLDLLVVGSHGHRFLADMALGQTVSPVLHRLSIPVLVVPSRPTLSPGGGGEPPAT